METEEIVSLQEKRKKVLEHFASRQPCLIGMEACGSAQHWARKLLAVRQELRLLPGEALKGLVAGNKGDRLPARLRESPYEEAVRIKKLNAEIPTVVQRIKDWLEYDQVCRRIAEAPGEGPSTAASAMRIGGDRIALKSAHDFATFVGLDPRQVGTGRCVKRPVSSRRSDSYFQLLMILGARSVLTQADDPELWVIEIGEQRSLNAAIVTLANKMAQTISAVPAHEQTHHRGFVSRPAKVGAQHTCINRLKRRVAAVKVAQDR